MTLSQASKGQASKSQASQGEDLKGGETDKEFEVEEIVADRQLKSGTLWDNIAMRHEQR